LGYPVLGNQLKASIIVSNYQGMEFLPTCLKHLVVQTYPDFEIIFVDAGSNDGSADYVQKNFPDIRLIRCGKIGIGEAINIGIRNSTGEILVFDVNTDEYVEPDWLEELVKQLERFQYNIITGTTRIVFGTELIDEAGVKLNMLGRAKKLGHFQEIDKFEFTQKPVDFVGSPAFHRKLIEKIGYVDEAFFIYAEDLEFCYRAKLAGINTYCAPNAKSFHHVRGTMGKNTKRLQYYLTRANMRFHIIYSSPLKLLIILIYNCIFLPFSSIVAVIMRLNKSALYHEKLIGRINAIKWNINNIKKTLMYRKKARMLKRRHSIHSNAI